jgi:four helix bundle protein
MRIYQLALELVASVFALAREVARKDKNLADQMKRACTSVPLNMQEGWYSRGGNRIARLTDAMASARETMACLHVSVAATYLTQKRIDADLDRIDQIVAVLYTLCNKPR